MRAVLLMSVLPLFHRPAISAPAEVAVAPFTVESDSSGVLRAVADSCLQQLVRTLTELHVSVAQLPELSEKTLTRARPAQLAVLGHVDREDGLLQAELRLLEVESGDELRSYFNADKDPNAVADLGAAAAKRIAQVVQERRQPGP
jgi:hypothetical protein